VWRWWRRRINCDGASWNEWLFGDADIVFADSCPWIATVAVGVGFAAHLWWGRRGKSCGGGCLCLLDAHVMDAESGEGVSTSTVFVGHAANWRWVWGSGGGAGDRGLRMLGNPDVVLANCGIRIAAFTIFVGHAAERRDRRN
jgi:hypothetical protein